MNRPRMNSFMPRWLALGYAAPAVFLLLVGGCTAIAPRASSPVATVPPLGNLPGAQIWNQGASSLLFGTNDTYEWSANNLETQPTIQQMLHTAGFTLVRTFIPDKAPDSTIETRIATIEHIGGSCLAVLANIDDPSFNEHVVSYLGNRCLLYEFGNEPDYSGISAADYLAAWNSTIPLLRLINPAARFIGPVTSTDEGGFNFLQQFLLGVKTSGILPDAISFHYYPCYNDSESSCLAKAGSYGTAALGVRRLVKQILGKELPVGISEWNYDPGNPPPAYGDNASFITQFTTTAIKSMIAAGVAFACQFDAASYSGYGALDMFDIDNDQAKPQYYALASLIKEYRPAAAAKKATSTTSSTSTIPRSALLSQGELAVCSANDIGPSEPAALTDGKFGNWGFWELADNTLPGWCALHLPVKANKVLLAWYSDYSFDYIDDTGLAPMDYDISVSADSTNGSNGSWQTVVSVRDNQARAREAEFGFAGMSWVKMTVLAAESQASQPYVRIDELQVFDADALGNNSFFFSGDSITAIAYGRSADELPSFADDLATCDGHQYPLMIDGGLGGWDSSGAAENIEAWLSLSPNMHYWLLGWGSNDALDDVSPEAFRANLETVIQAILEHGDVPVLADIPYSTYQNRPGLASEIQQLNQVIDEVTTENHLIPGPDFYTLFKAHPAYLSADGLHPNDAGSIAMNALWFQDLRSHLGLPLGNTCD
ncbi:MAG: GDSL-type esterase/lipase family protein [Ktedonobacterales bacterium]